MTKEWCIGEEYESAVSDWKKLIIDFRDQFPYDPLTALIVETFANSLDAGATEIKVYIDTNEGVFKIIDNGKGMSQEQFIEYHNIASLTKRKGEGIGFAGVGAKIYLDRCEYIRTETKSKDFFGASYWRFIGKKPKWKPVKTKEVIPYKTGTCVEVKIDDKEDKIKFNSKFVENVLHQFYNAILLGFYRVKKVYINDKSLSGWMPDEEETEEKEVIDIRIGKNRVKGFLLKVDSQLPEIFQGPSIVVYGKTVTQEWFRQYPICADRITGLIIADYLIKILRTSKSDFDRTAMLWKYFHNRIGNFIGNWLEKIGAKPKPPKVSKSLKELSQIVEETVNKLLKLPEFSEIANRLFQSYLRKTVVIKSEKGIDLGKNISGVQKISGTLGGATSGGKVPTIGNDEGEGVQEDEAGDIPIERVRRRVKGGIRIMYDDKPENFLEGWIDPSLQAVVINTGHPAWRIANEFKSQVYHLLRVVFTVLAEEINVEEPKKVIANLFLKLPEV